MNATEPIVNATEPISNSVTAPRVLFLDDEERILKTMKALFRSKYDVVTATDGQTALDYLRRDRVHLVVSDQRMPGMTGVEFLRKAKDVSPNTMRILLTGYSDLSAILGSINDGEVFRFISKPWDNQEIQKVIGEAVDIGLKLDSAAVAAPFPSMQTIPAIAEAILVISPNQPFSADVRALVKGSCEVVRVHSLQAALDALKIKEFAVVIVEADPGAEDVYLFLSLLKRTYPQVVTLLVTLSADAESAIALINRAQLFRFLVPPISSETLKASIGAAVRHALSLRASPAMRARHAVADVPEEKRTSIMSWLFDGLRSLPNRLRA
jgi:serine/threonine-protein kinase